MDLLPRARLDTLDDAVLARADARHTIHILCDCRTLHAISAADQDDVDIRRVELGQLRADRLISSGCVVIDATDGAGTASVLEFLRPLARRAPTIVLAREGDIRLAVRAVKAGAFDVLAKPVDPDEFWSTVRAALRSEASSNHARRSIGWVSHEAAREAVSSLTRRQHDILARIVQGQPNKIIAADLGISQRTAENHRAAIMRKLRVSSISALVQVALAANWSQG
jgi:FixJ family two-component response regulator